MGHRPDGRSHQVVAREPSQARNPVLVALDAELQRIVGEALNRAAEAAEEADSGAGDEADEIDAAEEVEEVEGAEPACGRTSRARGRVEEGVVG